MKAICTAIFYIVLVTFSKNTSAQYLTDINGRPFIEVKYTDIEGSPYLNDEWSVGFAKAKHNNKMYELKRVRYDIYKDELEYDVAGKYFRLSDQITEFSCGEGTFRNGFPNIESLTGRQFYQVLYDGHIKLLKRISIRIATEKVYSSASETKRFLKDEALYILKNGLLNRLKKDKKAIVELLADKQPTIETFIKLHKLKTTNEKDMILILEKYESE
jgi:hypothetical protein